MRMHPASLSLTFLLMFSVDVNEFGKQGVISEMSYANYLLMMSETINLVWNKFMKYEVL